MKRRSTKHEARNTKQYRMTQIQMFKTGFRILRIRILNLFRISDFGFRICSTRRGFTLIELLVVIGIIVLLAGIVMPNFMKYIDKAKKVRARADIHSIENALAMYQTDFGVYPGQTSADDLYTDIIDGNMSNLERMLQAVGTNGRGPYLSKDIPNDPYGTKYQYRAPGDPDTNKYHNPLTNRGYDLWSWGKDKADDSGEDDDITCWDTETD